MVRSTGPDWLLEHTTKARIARNVTMGPGRRRAPEIWVAVSRLPISITVDFGTEFTSKALKAWAWKRDVKPDFIRPGKPAENGHIESFNGRLRDECLSVN